MNLLFIFLMIKCFWCSLSQINAESPKVKNFMLIHADDMSPFIDPWVPDTHPLSGKTPNFDKLRNNGIVFKNTMVQQPVCGPSRASFLSGRYPDTTKIYNFDSFLMEVNEKIMTIPKYLKEVHGYYTAAFGKVFHPGFFDADAKEDAYEIHGHLSQKTKGYDTFGNTECSNSELYCNFGSFRKLTDENVLDSTLQFIRERESFRNIPWLAIVGFRRPHTDIAVPDSEFENLKFSDVKEKDTFMKNQPEIPNTDDFRRSLSYYECTKLDKKKVHKNPGSNKVNTIGNIKDLANNEHATSKVRYYYYVAIKWIDTLLGKILNQLEASGFKENTAIMFFSDHGWANGEHNIWCKNNLFPIGINVPMIVSVPWLNEGHGKISNNPTQLVDMFPSIIDIIEDKMNQYKTYNDGSGLKLDGVSFYKSLIDINYIHHVASYSQYPRCICNKNILVQNKEQRECPSHKFLSSVQNKVETIWENVQFHPCTTTQKSFDYGNCNRPEILWMGYSIFTKEYRYVEWRQFKEVQTTCSKYSSNYKITQKINYELTGTLWEKEPFQRELYKIDDNSYKYFNDWDSNNLAFDEDKYGQVMKDLSNMIKRKFNKEEVCNNIGLIRNSGTDDEHCEYELNESDSNNTFSPTKAYGYNYPTISPSKLIKNTQSPTGVNKNTKSPSVSPMEKHTNSPTLAFHKPTLMPTVKIDYEKCFCRKKK